MRRGFFMKETKKKVKKAHCKSCGGRGYEPDGLECVECKVKEEVKGKVKK